MFYDLQNEHNTSIEVLLIDEFSKIKRPPLELRFYPLHIGVVS